VRDELRLPQPVFRGDPVGLVERLLGGGAVAGAVMVVADEQTPVHAIQRGQFRRIEQRTDAFDHRPRPRHLVRHRVVQDEREPGRYLLVRIDVGVEKMRHALDGSGAQTVTGKPVREREQQGAPDRELRCRGRELRTGLQQPVDLRDPAVHRLEGVVLEVIRADDGCGAEHLAHGHTACRETVERLDEDVACGLPVLLHPRTSQPVQQPRMPRHVLGGQCADPVAQRLPPALREQGRRRCEDHAGRGVPVGGRAIEFERVVRPALGFRQGGGAALQRFEIRRVHLRAQPVLEEFAEQRVVLVVLSDRRLAVREEVASAEVVEDLRGVGVSADRDGVVRREIVEERRGEQRVPVALVGGFEDLRREVFEDRLG
jgi:hypothetical protein